MKTNLRENDQPETTVQLNEFKRKEMSSGFSYSSLSQSRALHGVSQEKKCHDLIQFSPVHVAHIAISFSLS